MASKIPKAVLFSLGFLILAGIISQILSLELPLWLFIAAAALLFIFIVLPPQEWKEQMRHHADTVKKTKQEGKFLLLEMLFIILIIGNIADFFELIHGGWDLLEKWSAWILLAYMLYHLSLTKLLFGIKRKAVDLLIILSAFGFIFKDIIETVRIAESEEVWNWLYQMTSFILKHDYELQRLGFLLGVFLLFFSALYLALRAPIKAPSLMHIIHEEGPPPRNIFRLLWRFFLIFLVLMGFYILFLNVFLEWIGIAIDAQLLIIAIVFVMLYYIKRKHAMSSSHIIYRLSHVGDKFFTEFIGMFHSKATFLLAFSGLLVMYIFTDVLLFMVPYLTGITDSLYLPQLGIHHGITLDFMVRNVSANSMAYAIPIIMTYALNAIGILFILLFPFVIWLNIFKGKEPHVGRLWLAVIVPSVLVFFLLPLFSINAIEGASAATGADIRSYDLFEINSWFSGVAGSIASASAAAAIIAVAVAFIVYYAAERERIKKYITYCLSIIGFGYFGYYTWLWTVSQTSVYKGLFTAVAKNLTFSNTVVLVALVIFYALLMLFYVFAYLALLVEAFQEFRGRKWSRPAEALEKHAALRHEWAGEEKELPSQAKSFITVKGQEVPSETHLELCDALAKLGISYQMVASKIDANIIVYIPGMRHALFCYDEVIGRKSYLAYRDKFEAAGQKVLEIRKEGIPKLIAYYSKAAGQ